MSSLREQMFARLREALPVEEPQSFSGPASLLEQLRSELQQLNAGMVGGACIDPDDIAVLRNGLRDWCRDEALPWLGASAPRRIPPVLETLEAHGMPLPAPAVSWTPPAPSRLRSVERIRAMAVAEPDVSRVGDPLSAPPAFEVPAELLELMAAFDGFELCNRSTRHPVLSLLESVSFDLLEAEAGYPDRIEVFDGGDDVALSLFNEQGWWLGYEVDRVPEGRRQFDLAALLEFGLRRVVGTEAELDNDLGWDAFFD